MYKVKPILPRKNDFINKDACIFRLLKPIEPDTVIVDERFVYMAFRISGYSVTERTESGFITYLTNGGALGYTDSSKTRAHQMAGYYLVEPVEGSVELNSADQITVPMTSTNISSEPEAGDILEIVYDGAIAESYPAQITNVYSISAVE